MFWLFGHHAYGILALQPGINPLHPALEGEVSTTGPSGRSLGQVSIGKLFIKDGFPGNPVLKWQKHNWVTNTNQPSKQPKEGTRQAYDFRQSFMKSSITLTLQGSLRV